MAFVHAAMKVGKAFTFTLDTSDRSDTARSGFRTPHALRPASYSATIAQTATGHEHDEAAMISGGCQLDCAHAAT